MEKLDLDSLFERNEIISSITDILNEFTTTGSKKGIYIYGPPGCGKTYTVNKILKSLNYDIILYNAGDVRNNNLFTSMDSNHLSNRNVLDLMYGRQKKIAIIMDEIDGMNGGDKGGIDSLIKLIRPKKTKKQKLEGTTINPIICIGSMNNDKKIRELMKVCQVFEIKMPLNCQIEYVMKTLVKQYNVFSPSLQRDILNYIQGDLRKLKFLIKIQEKKPELINSSVINDILHVKSYNEDAKNITWKLFNKQIPLQEHNLFMNETERTTVSLLWHENISDVIDKRPGKLSYNFYAELLNNMCFADYIGRVTFQSQIWQFNEMTSLIKTFHNNKKCHEFFGTDLMSKDPKNIEFTKILTKYSTEYNNKVFLQNLCQKLNLSKSDMIACFQEIRLTNFGSDNTDDLYKYFSKFDVSNLDIKRIYRFLDKNFKNETSQLVLEIIDDFSVESF